MLQKATEIEGKEETHQDDDGQDDSSFFHNKVSLTTRHRCQDFSFPW